MLGFQLRVDHDVSKESTRMTALQDVEVACVRRLWFVDGLRLSCHCVSKSPEDSDITPTDEELFQANDRFDLIPKKAVHIVFVRCCSGFVACRCGRKRVELTVGETSLYTWRLLAEVYRLLEDPVAPPPPVKREVKEATCVDCNYNHWLANKRATTSRDECANKLVLRVLDVLKP
jgi:hypothetical protein